MTPTVEELLLAGLNEVKSDMKALRKSVQQCREDVAGLKVKATVWGMLGGLFSAIGAALLAAAMTLKGGK